ncbi:metal-dependent amidase aminoacylase carboxypeptidase [Ophiostoma piceae UAMH 11346]|uniref:Peptidase M20 domain-containing protein 2 n=1 Tax=Ophiostoma piceae (strain UAMH 11346) TaxID=1262450 RepID=S3BWL9_OPHP1|nr:metal-dependent amidase aminoacylase carboxypeptidase [Ophiostoma piceae UAMH 11346]
MKATPFTSQDSAAAIKKSLTANEDILWDLNQKIFNNPEIAYEEFAAHDNLVAVLSTIEGVRVTPHAYGLETAFEAEFGSGGRVLTFNAEYDALPGMGHACGHNLIATVGLSSFMAVVDTLKQTGAPGRVRLLGTPAEETTGGKIKLIAAGAYKDVDACLMMHPTTQAVYGPESVYGDAFDRTLAITGFAVRFKGKSAHAAIAPWDGINALDAAVAGYTAVSVLRQQIRPDERIHGIITDGGSRPNVIPETSRLEYGVRAPSLVRAQELQKRAIKCFEGAAESTGCSIEIEELGYYADLRASIPICNAFVKAMGDLGREVQCNVDRTTPASTDQGNVSYECPSWHGIFGIPSEEGAYPHTASFATGAGLRRSFDRALENSEGMAQVGYRFLVEDKLAADVKACFEAQKNEKA